MELENSFFNNKPFRFFIVFFVLQYEATLGNILHLTV